MLAAAPPRFSFAAFSIGAYVSRAHASLPGSHLIVTPECGDIAPMERPDAVTAAIREPASALAAVGHGRNPRSVGGVTARLTRCTLGRQVSFRLTREF